MQTAHLPLKLPPWSALLLLLALLIVPGGLLLKLNINNAPEVYFPETAPAMVLENQLRQDFPLDQVLIALFEGEDLLEPAFLRRLEDLIAALAAEPLIERVIALPTLDAIRATEDGFSVEPLLDSRLAENLTTEERRDRVLTDRFASGLLVSQQADAIAVVVRPIDLDSSLQRLAIEDAVIRGITNAGLAQPTAIGGHIALDTAQLRSMIRDSLVFIPGTLSIAMVLLWWLFRRWLVLVIAALVIGAVVNVTLGLLVVAGKPFTLISAILPPLMSALSVALLIHWFNALNRAAQIGLTGRERVQRALDIVARPALFTALTTGVGLASLGFSPIQPVEAFGLVAAAGVLVLFLIVIGLLPAIIAHWDHAPWPGRRQGIGRMQRLIRTFSALGIRRAGWVVGLTIVAFVLLVPQIFKVETETDLFRFFKSDHPITLATERIQDQLTGVTTLEVVLDAEGRDSLKDPERLRAIRELADWLEARPAIDRALSMADLIEEMHWAFNGEDPSFRAIPDSGPLIAQYLLLYDGEDLHELVNREFDRTRIQLNLNVHGAREINAVIDDIETRVAQQPPADMTVTVGGFGRLFADQERLLIQGQIRSLLSALVLISVLMYLTWRSIGRTLLTMIPNLAPVVVVFATMGLFGIWLDMATAMIASVTVGIAVDDTIHLFNGYLRRRKAGSTHVQALVRTYHYEGRAVTATTILLCAQFSLLGLSPFIPTIEFGLLTALGLFAALIFDLLLLPAMLTLLALRERIPTVSPTSGSSA